MARIKPRKAKRSKAKKGIVYPNGWPAKKRKLYPNGWPKNMRAFLAIREQEWLIEQRGHTRTGNKGVVNPDGIWHDNHVWADDEPWID